MAAPARALLSHLPKGHRLPDTRFQITTDEIARYMNAVGDTNPLYLERGLAPPLAVAARALGAVLETIELPAGALHTGQEVEAHAGVPIGSTLTLSGRIAQRSERAGLIISVIEFEATPEGAPTLAVTGRTTVMAPASASTAGGAT